MVDISQWMFGASLLSISIAVLKLNNGNGKLKEFIRRPECHSAMDGIKEKIGDLKNHIDTRIEDLKDFLIKNGKS